MRSLLLPVAALLLGVSFLILGNGLLGLLIPVRAQGSGFATFSIGVMATAYFAGFALGCVRVPHVLMRVGHIRTFASLSALAACAALVHAMVVDPISWTILRAITGFCLAGLYTTIESWLNAKAGNVHRGQIFSIYMVINYGAITVGQLMLAALPPQTFVPFAIVAICLSLALVPVSLTSSSAPTEMTTARLRLRYLYGISPLGVVGCLTVGLVNGAFWSLAPVFAQQQLGSVADVALFMSAAVVGGALAQLPLGRWSDRTDRRRVIVATAAAGAVACAAVVAVGGYDRNLLVLLAVLVGSCIFTLYSLCVAHANDFAAPEDFVEVSSGLLLTFGVGASAGPLLASSLMEAVGAYGVFVFMGLLQLVFAGYAILRIRRREAVPEAERTDFVDAPRTTPVVFELDPRSPDNPEAEPADTARAAGNEGAAPPR